MLLAFEVWYQHRVLTPGSGAMPETLVYSAWLMSFWVAVSHVPEDSPAHELSFVATRPLPPRSYWAARALVFLLMIVLPIAVQHFICHALTQRPWADVLSAAWDGTMQWTSQLAWLLPFTALWRGTRQAMALGLMAAVMLIVVLLWDPLDVVLPAWQPMQSLSLPPEWHPGLGLVALLSLVTLALRHHCNGGPCSYAARLTGFGFITAVVMVLSGLWHPLEGYQLPADQAQAERLGRESPPAIVPHSVRVSLYSPNSIGVGAQAGFPPPRSPAPQACPTPESADAPASTRPAHETSASRRRELTVSPAFHHTKAQSHQANAPEEIGESWSSRLHSLQSPLGTSPAVFGA